MKNIPFKVCRWLLGLIGISVLDSCELINLGRAEYGCPYSDFEVKGKVVDKVTGKPLSKIEVIPCIKNEALSEEDGHVYYQIASPDTTGVDGVFNISERGMLFYDTVFIKLQDLDDLDGDFGEIVVEVPLTGKNTENAGHWYAGQFVYDAGTVELTEKPE